MPARVKRGCKVPGEWLPPPYPWGFLNTGAGLLNRRDRKALPMDRWKGASLKRLRLLR